jgi:hypothetical protein
VAVPEKNVALSVDDAGLNVNPGLSTNAVSTVPVELIKNGTKKFEFVLVSSTGISLPAPVAPTGPVAPVEPVAPFVPSTPSGPIGPVAPVGPCEPVGPVAP